MRFPRVVEHFFSVVLVRSRCCVDFACVAILLFPGPKLEVLLFFSAFYAGRAVSTACSRVIRHFFVAVSVLSESIRRAVLTAFYGGFVVFCCCDCIFTGYSSFVISVLSQSIHVPTMITSRSDSIHSRRASMCHP